MNKYQKQNKKAKWIFIQWKGNMALYAACNRCGFYYHCDKDVRDEDGTWKWEKEPGVPYNYCPNCGRKMSLYDKDKKVHKMDYYGYEQDTFEIPDLEENSINE